MREREDDQAAAAAARAAAAAAPESKSKETDSAESEKAPEQAAAQDAPIASDTDAALADLRQQLEREKSAREASQAAQRNAEAEAAQLRQRVQQGEISVRQAQLIAVSRALDAHVAQLDGFREQYAQALAAGDFSKAAEIQAGMSEAAAKKVQLAAAKEQLEKAPEPAQAAVPTRSNPTEDALRAYTPRTQEWLRRHPEVISDPKRMQLAVAAHHAALAADHIPDSDAYFDAIERTMGYKADPAAQSGGTRKPLPSAPPNRGSGMGNGKPATLRLDDMTPKMRQLAKEADMKPEEWLRNYNDLVSEGKVERMH